MLRPFMSDAAREKLVGTRISFMVPWDTAPRAGTITRVNGLTIWIGAYCYLIDELMRVREYFE